MGEKFKNYHGESSIVGSFPARMWFKVLKRFPWLNYKINLVMQLPEGGKVLDVGCGIGSFLKYINKFRPDLELYGLDVSPDLEDKIPEFIDFTQGSGDELPYEDEEFDLVVSQHVLEHVQNPEDFVKEFRRVSKKYVLVVTPNHKKTFLWDSMNFWADPTHVRPHTKSSIKKLFESNGLSTIKLKHVRDIDVPLPGILLLILYSLFSRRFKFSSMCAHIVKYSVLGVGKK